MLKKIGLLATIGFMTTTALAADIQLPLPDKTNTTSLMHALETRQSDHSFSNQALDDKTLSTVLWVAYGVNRPDGKRTIPTAKDGKDLDIYVFNPAGIWLYDAPTNTLQQKSDKNELALFNKQDYMSPVSTVLVYTGSTNDYAAMHAGSAYQNVELYAAANNMASIVRGYYDQEKVAQALNLPQGQRVIISQAIGWK